MISLNDFTTDELDEISKLISGDLDIDNIDRDLADKLYEFYVDDMPYMTAKGRDGVPDDYIMEHLEDDFG